MKKLALFCVCVLALASCSEGQQKTDTALSQRVDSLSQIIAQKDNEINDMMSTFGEIEEGFRAISEAQDRVAVAKSGEGANTKERLRENIQFIQNTMKQNKELINKLKQQLDALRKLVDSMQKELEEKEQQMQQLRAELDSKEIHIMELDEQVANLNNDVAELTTENTQRAETISTQDKQLNTAWFVFGTKNELKEQQILVDGKVLQSSFNKEYFTKIDIRVDKEIKLYSKSAEILTSHPSSSYTLQRDANKQYVLRITDPQLFWSTSKYLVVLVK